MSHFVSLFFVGPLQHVDLNGDGKKDLLATTNTANGKGAVYAFELVGDFKLQGLANKAWAFGLLGHVDGQLFMALSTEAERQDFPGE